MFILVPLQILFCMSYLSNRKRRRDYLQSESTLSNEPLDPDADGTESVEGTATTFNLGGLHVAQH